MPVPACQSRVRLYVAHIEALLCGVFAGTFPFVLSSTDALTISASRYV